MNRLTTKRPLIVGEVLFDCFPDGRRVLGGAPFNVAWNLCGLGIEPMLLTAVGDDHDGREVRSRMLAWGLSTAGVQTSCRYPTGCVSVKNSAAGHTFEILDKQAYDDIEHPAEVTDTEAFSLLYVGSLAFRREPSRTTIRRLLNETSLPRLVDINLREPWFDRATCDELLHGASIAKLNEHELAWLMNHKQIASDRIGEQASAFREAYAIRTCFVTCGGDGAWAVDEQGSACFAKAPSAEPLIDTVGAGDAFSAAVIYGSQQGWSLEKTLRAAVSFASATCSRQGATSEDRAHYGSLDGYLLG